MNGPSLFQLAHLEQTYWFSEAMLSDQIYSEWVTKAFSSGMGAISPGPFGTSVLAENKIEQGSHNLGSSGLCWASMVLQPVGTVIGTLFTNLIYLLLKEHLESICLVVWLVSIMSAGFECSQF